jgi:hypothetical protein
MKKASMLSALALLALASVCVAEILNVPDDYETIQAAIDGSEDGDTILVAPGEYLENIDFAGKNIVMIGDPENPEEVVIDGNERGTVVTFANNETEAAVLNGFTITNGFSNDRAGGIAIIGSGPTIMHCRIIENRSNGDGGGIVVSGGSPVIISCSISNNSPLRFQDSVGAGGGIYCVEGSNITLEDCDFIANVGRSGIHLYCNDSEATLQNCVFDSVGNRDEYQSGIEFINSTGTIENCQLLELPRAVVAANSILSINGSLFSGSRGSGEYSPGAAIYATNGSFVEVTYSVFERGGSFDAGSAIYSEVLGDVEESNVIARNCTFANNEPANVVENISAINCIFYNNEAEWHRTNVIRFCLVEREVEGEGNIIGEDPLFANIEEGDYHLTAESPCIDTGDPDSPLDPDSTRADMGAFYFHQRDIEVEPDSIVFLLTDIGDTTTDYLTINNLGGDTLIVDSLWLEDEGDVFEIVEGSEPFELEPEGEHETFIAFAPQDTGEYRAVLKIASNDPDEGLVEVPISGTAIIRAPDIVADADTLDFGEVAAGSAVDRTLTVTNEGNDTLFVRAQSILRPSSSFQIVSGGGYYALLPDDSHQTGVRFYGPDRPGVHYTRLLIESDDPETPHLVIALVGESYSGVESNPAPPLAFSLEAASPNPFNASFAVSYQLSAVSRVSLKLYDVAGRLVSNQQLGISNPGNHRAVIDGSCLSSGVYFLKLAAESRIATRKIVCVK